MSLESQNNDNQEIDLSEIGKKIGGFFDGISATIFSWMIFIKRNIVIIGILFVLGIALGFYFDKTSKNYNHNIIVTPNFGSGDYLYAKVSLLNSKIKENDSVFLNSIGFLNSKKINSIEIEPIIDLYKFVDNNTANFELIKLMAEDGDIQKISKDEITSKNYPYHILKINTSNIVTEKGLMEPLLNYLNTSDYFSKIRKEYVNNVTIKMNENDSIIKQINGFLSDFKVNSNSNKSNNLVYYSENNQLNDIIKTKEGLITEQGSHRLELVNFDKIVKDLSIVSNIKNTASVNGKMKLILPILFIFLFVLFSIFKSFYNNQLEKSKL